MTTTGTPTIQARRSDDLLDVPPILAELMAGEEALVTHLAVSDRYRETVGKTTELARELEVARREDDERRRAALTAGKKTPEPKAPGIEDALAQSRRDVELLSASVRDSMAVLATAAVAFVDRADAELRGRQEASVERLRDLFGAAAATLTEHETLAAEHVWVSALRVSGRVAGYRAGATAKTLRRTSEEIARLGLALDEDLGRRAEAVEASEREADAALPLPPGARVWRGAETLTVSETGELVEDEEAPR